MILLIPAGENFSEASLRELFPHSLNRMVHEELLGTTSNTGSHEGTDNLLLFSQVKKLRDKSRQKCKKKEKMGMVGISGKCKSVFSILRVINLFSFPAVSIPGSEVGPGTTLIKPGEGNL